MNAETELDPLRVVVTGDVTMDWNLAQQPLAGHDAEGAQGTRASWQRGGAALLADLVEAVAAGLGRGTRPVSVLPPEAPRAPIPPGDDSLNHSYATWSRFGSAWRVESFLGIDRARTDAGVHAEWASLARNLPAADVVVLDDGALGFRDYSDRELWRRTGAAGRRPWVVLKAARPVAEGALWEHLLAELAERLIVVITIEDLRGTEVQVSRELSWERTAQDLFWELVHKPRVNALSRVAHTIVSFGAAGAALVTGPAGGSDVPKCSLLYDPEVVEGTWEAQQAGRMMGSTDCLVAGLVRELLLAPDAPALTRAIQGGVAAARRVHLEGYTERGVGRLELGFPVSLVAEELGAGREPLQQVDVPDPAAATGHWTILRERCTGDLAEPAARTTVAGPEEALPGVPLARFGALTTADRSEIESFRSVAALISEYCRIPQSKPVSIGVFGPPGSGKSFGIVQVARSVASGQVSDPLEFNLSQLRSPDELADAFHLVRDVGLAGRVPLVFWDEFDTPLEGKALGWLRYFLAPMQDGEFRQGQLVHPIGRSIFVFAGGTCERVQEFGARMDPQLFREAKGPDFVSRLRGYVDIMGPNPQGEGDAFHLIRRAILLRSILRRRARQLFDGDRLNIDSGVLRAFLETTTYRHGARSLEAIVLMSRLAGKSTYERSSLPAEAQLDLHVDSRNFLSLVQRMTLDGELLEQLARAAHEVYCDGLRARDYVWGPVADDAKKISDSLVEYDQLPAYKLEEDRGSVRDIPAKLAQLGLVIVPARGELPPFTFTEDEQKLLARQEHERWMQALGVGWHHGFPTDKARKVHEAYLPWEQLPEPERDRDVDLVREIPKILARAGYAVVRCREPEESTA